MQIPFELLIAAVVVLPLFGFFAPKIWGAAKAGFAAMEAEEQKIKALIEADIHKLEAKVETGVTLAKEDVTAFFDKALGKLEEIGTDIKTVVSHTTTEVKATVNEAETVVSDVNNIVNEAETNAGELVTKAEGEVEKI